MKKILLLSALAIFTTVTTKAQEVHFGLKGGLNLANLSISNKSGGTTTSPDTSFRPSFYIGGLAEFAVDYNFFVEAGLQYANNGTKFSEETAGTKYEYSLSLNQLNIPITAKYAIAEGFMLKGGVYVGYLISGSEKTKETTGGISKENTENIDFEDDEYKRADFGLSVGAEYNLPQENIFFEASYNFGLKDFNDSDNGKTYTRSIQLGVGYKF